jgi:hypothetical protein
MSTRRKYDITTDVVADVADKRFLVELSALLTAALGDPPKHMETETVIVRKSEALRTQVLHAIALLNAEIQSYG